MQALNKWVGELIAKNIVPHMEKKLAHLYAQVCSVRKGLKNQWSRMLWGKSKGDGAREGVLEDASGQVIIAAACSATLQLLSCGVRVMLSIGTIGYVPCFGG